MLKFTKVSDEKKIEEVLKSITTYHEISTNGSSIKRVGFESSLYGKGYFHAESYSGIEVFIEQKPKVWILAIDEKRYVTDNNLKLAKKFVAMKHQFAARSEAEDFISDIGEAQDIIEIIEIDPNNPEETKKTFKEFNLDEIPF